MRNAKAVMSSPSAARIILLDIEGTVAPVSFVHDVLFPYARSRMETYLREHWDDSAVASARSMLNEPAGDFSEPSLALLKTALFALMDRDVKSTGLKQLQGLIWDEGYRNGMFQSPVFPDVAPAIRRWVRNGKSVAIYSSGSVAAQKGLFPPHDRRRSDALSSGAFRHDHRSKKIGSELSCHRVGFESGAR